MNISSIVKTIKIFVVDHGPEILTAVGTVGLIISGVMAVKETPKAMDILDSHIEEKEDAGELPELTKKEVFLDCWKVYLPSVLLASSSVASIIIARRIDSTRAAALAAAYKMSEEALLRLEDATKEEYGENKLKKLKTNAAVKEMQEHIEGVKESDILETGCGSDLFYCPYNTHFFRANINYLDKIFNSYVSDVLTQNYQNVNDWVTRIGFNPMEILGTGFGVNASMLYGMTNLKLDIEYGPGPLGEPCGIVRLPIDPVIDYWNPHG